MFASDRRFSGVSLVCLLFLTCAGLRAELVAHYRLDEAVGGTNVVVDSVGGNDGTLINAGLVGREFEPAPFRVAYDFRTDAVQGGGVDLGTSAAVRPQTNWTVTWWMQLDELDAFERLVESMNGTASTSRGIRFDLGSAGNHVRILLRDGTGAQLTVEHTRVLSTGTWYFVAARCSSSGVATGRVTVVAENDPLGGGVVSANTVSGTNATLGPIQYAASRPTVLAVEDSAGSSRNALDVQMDDVAFFDTVLDDGQVKFVRRFGAQTLLPSVGWDAVDPGGQPATKWSQNVGAALAWNLSGGAGTPSFADVTSRYRIPRALEFVGAGEAVLLPKLPGRDRDMSIEVWFKPRDLAENDREVLFETGGDANGCSLLLDGAELKLRYDQDAVSDLAGANHLVASHTLDHADLRDFVQAVGVVDLGNDRIALFVNGELIAEAAPPGAGTSEGDMTSWAGGNDDHIGSRRMNDDGGVGGDDGNDLDAYTPFDGHIGVVRFYEGTVLTAEQVRANYEAMLVAAPRPGTVLFLR